MAEAQRAAGGAPAAIDAKVRKFPCGQCGADVVWNPGVSALRCPYCGAEKAVPTTARELREHPIEEALREPKDLGWGSERKAIRCNRCGAVTTLEPAVAASRCAFCGTPAVVEAPLDGKMVRPEGLLPFRVDRTGAVAKFRSWISGLWFRPNDLGNKAAVTGMSGVYIPFWTFDAATHSLWTADAGTFYYVDVEAVENGQSVIRQEQRVRWEPAEGFLEKFFDDLPVAASKGLERSLAEAIEPFPTSELVGYDPSYLSGFLAEEYAVGVEDALAIAKRRMQAEIEAACSAQVPGDTQRNLQVQTTTSGLTYRNALLPVWIAAYDYSGTPYRFLVNGVTGKVSGKAPWSWLKIGLALLAAAVLLYLTTR